MKSNFAHIGLAKLCGWFGITRQAYYQNNWEGVSTTLEEELIIQQVKNIRKNQSRRWKESRILIWNKLVEKC